MTHLAINIICILLIKQCLCYVFYDNPLFSCKITHRSMFFFIRSMIHKVGSLFFFLLLKVLEPPCVFQTVIALLSNAVKMTHCILERGSSMTNLQGKVLNRIICSISNITPSDLRNNQGHFLLLPV